MKKCKECKKVKPEEEFYQNGLNGTRPRCKKCEQKKNNKVFKNKNCSICGTSFKPVSFLNKYCSSKCKIQAELEKRSKKPKTKNCKVCNKEFKPYTSLDKFCSPNCRYENGKNTNRKTSRRWSREKLNKRNGKDNPAYRNGMYSKGVKVTGQGLAEFRRNGGEILNKMIEEKGFVYCQRCTTANTPRFEKHHIIYRSEKPKHPELHSKINIIVLCIKCHNELHKTKRLRSYLVEERKLHLIFGNSVLNK